MGKINNSIKNKLTVTEGVAAIITDISVLVKAGDKTYFYIPYWFEATDEPNVFIAHHLDGELPEDLINAIEMIREIKEQQESENKNSNFLEN